MVHIELDFSGLQSLWTSAPRALYIVFIAGVIDSISYISTALILTAYLSASLEFSDQQAGWIYSIYGIATSLFSIGAGVVVDKLGVRKIRNSAVSKRLFI